MIYLPELRAHRDRLDALEALLAKLPPLPEGLFASFSEAPRVAILSSLFFESSSKLVDAWFDAARESGFSIGYVIWSEDVYSPDHMVAMTPELPGFLFRLRR